MAAGPPVEAGFRLPPVIGHRGAAGLAPENTLAGFRLAAALGAPWVELDVRLSGDRHCVVFHDATLERITGDPRRVEQVALADLSRLDAGSWFDPGFAGEPIPTLAEALALIADLGLGINIELKRRRGGGEPLVAAVVKAVAAGWPGAAAPPLLSSFDAAILAAAARLAPALPRGLVCRRLPAGWKRAARRLGCAAIHVAAGNLTAANVARLKAAGLAVGAWSVDDPARARELWEWGVDGVFTNLPDRIMAAWRGR